MRYRICWSASTNISFEGKSEWIDEPNEDENTLHSSLDGGDGLQMALDESGFEWWVEIEDENGMG